MPCFGRDQRALQDRCRIGLALTNSSAVPEYPACGRPAFLCGFEIAFGLELFERRQHQLRIDIVDWHIAYCRLQQIKEPARLA